MDEIITCPQCDHEQDESECFLGRLGYLTHYRCRYCGWTFSIEPAEGDDVLSELASHFRPDEGGEA